MRAYDSLAEWFEILNDDCDYPAWSQYFIDKLSSLGAGKRGLELGCGSGAFCRSLAAAGYAMSGADVSLPMLAKAEALAREAGAKISFFVADAAALRVPEPFDFILAPNDVYNYVPQGKLPSAFKRVFACLPRGGIFWFDLSSEHKLCEKVADTVSADDREDVTYLSFNRREKETVEMDVTLFVRRKDGAFDRFDERHVQHIHRDGDVRAALAAAGFDLLCAEDRLGAPLEEADRIHYICRKP